MSGVVFRVLHIFVHYVSLPLCTKICVLPSLTCAVCSSEMPCVYILYSIQWDALCTYYTAYSEMPYVRTYYTAYSEMLYVHIIYGIYTVYLTL